MLPPSPLAESRVPWADAKSLFSPFPWCHFPLYLCPSLSFVHMSLQGQENKMQMLGQGPSCATAQQLGKIKWSAAHV